MSARKVRLVAASALLLGGAAAAPGCGDAGHAGELMAVFQTDMSLPKDVDRARIQVLARGDTKFDETYVKLGSEESLKLPGTLGVLVGEDPDTPVTFRVTAWQGDTPRVLREAVSTVPENRLAELRLPIQWLCDGFVQADGEDVASTCPEGQTCIAGSCGPKEIDSSNLPDYDEGSVFGGGSGDGDGECFDTANCMRGATLTELLTDGTCGVSISGDVNLAILTEGDGICGPSGCFIPLDADSDLGWQREGGTARLPQGLCDKLTGGKIVGIAVAPLGDGCPLKDETLPTCGPWSNTGEVPAPGGVTEPIALATLQDHPSGLAIDGTYVYWTNRGSFGASDASLKAVFQEGGTPIALIEGLSNARDLAIDIGDDLATTLFWTNAGIAESDGKVYSLVPGAAEAIDLTTEGGDPVGIPSPEGITARGLDVFFTSFSEGTLYYAPAGGGGGLVSLPLDAPQNYPYRIAFDDELLFWTNEGTASADPPDGSVMMAPLADLSGTDPVTPTALASEELIPRALLLDYNNADKDVAVTLYYTTFSEGGAVKRIDLGGGTPDEPEELAGGQSYPNGLASDATHIYWANRGDGTIKRLPKTASPGDEPQVVASGQLGPGPIALSDTHVYWANEGVSDVANGSILRIAKPQ